MRVGLAGLLVLALAGSVACSRGGHSKAAVEEAIEDHLRQQRSVAAHNMTLELGQVTFEGDTAVAEVKFRSKQAPIMVVGVQYRLRRVGKGWQVEASSATSMPRTSPHGEATTSMPPVSGNPEDIGPQPSH